MNSLIPGMPASMPAARASWSARSGGGVSTSAGAQAVRVVSRRIAGRCTGRDRIIKVCTRVTRRLYQDLGLPVPRLLSNHDHNERQRASQVVALLSEGQDVAVVSDAGTPLVSDPGYRAVVAAVEAGATVRQGDLIAEIGATGRASGPHLDWRMNWLDRRVDPQRLVEGVPRPAAERVGEP